MTLPGAFAVLRLRGDPGINTVRCRPRKTNKQTRLCQDPCAFGLRTQCFCASAPLMLRFPWCGLAAWLGNLSRLLSFPRVKYEMSHGPAILCLDFISLTALLRDGATDTYCANQSSCLASLSGKSRCPPFRTVYRCILTL